MVSCSRLGSPCPKQPFLATCEGFHAQDHSGGRLSSAITFCWVPLASIRARNTGGMWAGSTSIRWPQYRHPSAEARNKASRCARLSGYPRPGCAMPTPRDGGTEPKGIVGVWSYACPFDRSHMPLDTAPELLTFVLHHHCRIPCHMLRDHLVWSKYSNALSYRGLRTGQVQIDCAVCGF